MEEIKLKKDIHTVSLLVANKPGVLVRIAQVFARRGFNIDSLAVCATLNPKYSRMTIMAQGDPQTLEQIIKQSAKLIDVIHVAEHSTMDAVSKELALVKIKCTTAAKAMVIKLLKKHKARIIDETENFIIIEQTGFSADLDAFESVIKKYGMIEMMRSGKLVMAKGRGET